MLLLKKSLVPLLPACSSGGTGFVSTSDRG
jgi:hypothetical protein